MRSKMILVVIDPSTEEAQPVLERAAWLAERVKADLELFTCDYDTELTVGYVEAVWTPDPGAREQSLLRHRQKLEAFAKPLRARGLNVTVNVAWDQPLEEAIIKAAVEREAWLVAKDTHHHNILRRTLFTNTDWQLIRHCPAPLWLVKARELAAEPTVLAAVDPLHEHDKPALLDDKIFEFAGELARAAGGTTHVVHAFTAPMGVELPPNVRDLIAQQHEAAMTRFLSKHAIPNEHVHVYEGIAHECLQRAAADHAADFVVMGAVSRRGLNRLFIGSTAERALDRLPCDLIILKPTGFEGRTKVS